MLWTKHVRSCLPKCQPRPQKLPRTFHATESIWGGSPARSDHVPGVRASRPRGQDARAPRGHPPVDVRRSVPSRPRIRSRAGWTGQHEIAPRKPLYRLGGGLRGWGRTALRVRALGGPAGPGFRLATGTGADAVSNGKGGGQRVARGSAEFGSETRLHVSRRAPHAGSDRLRSGWRRQGRPCINTVGSARPAEGVERRDRLSTPAPLERTPPTSQGKPEVARICLETMS